MRLIRPDEFTSEFEEFGFRTFVLEEPVAKHLGITELDECVRELIQRILQRAKEDGCSLGIYDVTNDDNNTRHEVTKVCMSTPILIKTHYFSRVSAVVLAGFLLYHSEKYSLWCS